MQQKNLWHYFYMNNSKSIQMSTASFKKIFFTVVIAIIAITSCKTTDTKTSGTEVFDKLVFHTGVCFGFCPVYHMEIDKNGDVKLQVERFNQRAKRSEMDSSKIGYFTGKVNKQLFDQLVAQLDSVNIQSQGVDSTLCCDGSLKTIISYYNGKRFYYKAMFPREPMQPVIAALLKIAGDSSYQRTDNVFKVEEP